MTTTLSGKARQALEDIIVAQLDVKPEQLTPEATLSDLGADSLDKVEITMRVEEAFGISIPDDAVVETVGEVFGLAANLLEGK